MLNEGNLQAGITFWHNQRRWPNDFHVRVYQNLAEPPAGARFNMDWWTVLWHELWFWAAVRGRGPVRTFEQYTARVQDRFGLLEEAWEVVGEHLAAGHDLLEVPWEDAAPLFHLAHEIKNVQSPVFASKFCHLLAPRIYPVVDGAAMGGVNGYPGHYAAVIAEWQNAPAGQLEALKAILQEVANGNLPDNYPFRNKLYELCHIGANHP